MTQFEHALHHSGSKNPLLKKKAQRGAAISEQWGERGESRDKRQTVELLMIKYSSGV